MKIVKILTNNKQPFYSSFSQLFVTQWTICLRYWDIFVLFGHEACPLTKIAGACLQETSLKLKSCRSWWPEKLCFSWNLQELIKYFFSYILLFLQFCGDKILKEFLFDKFCNLKSLALKKNKMFCYFHIIFSSMWAQDTQSARIPTKRN